MKISEEIALEFNRLVLVAEAKVLAHIAGASGAGKSTLLDLIKEKYPNVIVKDLDDIDDDARDALGLLKIKDDWTDEQFNEHQKMKQKVLNDFVKENEGSQIVLAGFHSEGAGEYAIDISTSNKFLLDVDAETAAQRAFQRSENNSTQTRSLDELPQDIEEAQADIDAIKAMGYLPKSAEEILSWVGENS